MTIASMPRRDAERQQARSSQPRLVVVSYAAHAPFSPRGIRTRELLERLQDEWTIELVARPSAAGSTGGAHRPVRSLIRRAGRRVHSALLFDKYELWSRRRFRSWSPDADGALLIAFPFSPVFYASRRLAERQIPFVVDAGDPWVLTGADPAVSGAALARARTAERQLWATAAGAILTTEAQARALSALFPHLKLLVRPNGFAPGSRARLTP